MLRLICVSRGLVGEKNLVRVKKKSRKGNLSYMEGEKNHGNEVKSSLFTKFFTDKLCAPNLMSLINL